MENTVTVLMTGAGAPGAPGIIRCLRKNGERSIRIVGVDMNREDLDAENLICYPLITDRSLEIQNG